ncbi:MAG: histidine kinase [Candidatus Competibacteraceae bacterium]
MGSIINLQEKASNLPDHQSFLPNFCSNPVIFVIVLIAQLLALVLVLASFPETQNFWTELALNSLFIQWVALSTAAVLCGLGSFISQLTTMTAAAVAYGLSQLITIICSLAALWIMKVPFGAESLQTLLTNLTISSIVTLAALRYFYVQQQWKHNIQAEAQHRLKILQTRIRPHFLFNSLNTIASLIRVSPNRLNKPSSI